MKHLKDCPKCGKRAGCTDTRMITDGRIRRRYRCKCKTAWSSIETIIRGSRKGIKTQVAADREQYELARKQLQADLRALLGIEIPIHARIKKVKMLKVMPVRRAK